MRIASETHLNQYLGTKIKDCSGGTKRRVSICSALIGNPPMIFLDEPSTGVDPENRRTLWEIIAKMKRPDRVILMTTHHLEEAEFLSEDVIILSKGLIKYRDNPEGIKNALGVGYRLVVNNIRDRRGEIYQLLNEYLPYMNINEDKLTDLGEIRIELKKDTQTVAVQVIERLE